MANGCENGKNATTIRVCDEDAVAREKEHEREPPKSTVCRRTSPDLTEKQSPGVLLHISSRVTAPRGEISPSIVGFLGSMSRLVWTRGGRADCQPSELSHAMAAEQLLDLAQRLSRELTEAF